MSNWLLLLRRRPALPALLTALLLLFLGVYAGLLRSLLASKRASAAANNNNPWPRGLQGHLANDRQLEASVRHLMMDDSATAAAAAAVAAEGGDRGDTNWTRSEVGCRSMGEIEQREFLAAGWTKAVYGARLRGRPVAVKVVNVHGHDFESCLDGEGTTAKDCYRKSAAKIIKEIVLLKELIHDNILKILGYCIPSGDYSEETGNVVAMVTELGTPVDIIKLLQMSWEDRLRISLGVARLLYHLAHSHLGSLAMNDFRRQQFVIINGEMKLSDVDDVGVEEPHCVNDSPCVVNIPANNSSIEVKCNQGLCKGYNELQNIAKAGRHFTTFLLPHGAPKSLRPLIDELVQAYGSLKWDSRRILEHTEKIAHLFTSGKYLKGEKRNELKAFKKLSFSDLPGEYDYRCQFSLSGNGCTLSVFDVKEAQDVCSNDPDCEAFVMTQQTTWTGRKLVHFKNNYSYPVWNAGTDLYVKVP